MITKGVKGLIWLIPILLILLIASDAIENNKNIFEVHIKVLRLRRSLTVFPVIKVLHYGVIIFFLLMLKVVAMFTI